MKNKRSIVVIGLLFIAILGTGGVIAAPTRKDTSSQLQSSAPSRPSNDESASAKNPYAAAAAPVLSSDVPEVGIAAFKGDIHTLRRLISSGTNIEAAGTDKRTPLLLAAAGGHPEA